MRRRIVSLGCVRQNVPSYASNISKQVLSRFYELKEIRMKTKRSKLSNLLYKDMWGINIVTLIEDGKFISIFNTFNK